MDFSHFFPYKWHEEMRVFGLCDWLKFNLDVNIGDYQITASWATLRAAGASKRMVDFVAATVGTHEGLNLRGASIILQMRAAGIALVQGPRIFYPTENQFEGCEELGLHIPIEEYQQPYEVMIVRIPDGCRKRLSEWSGLPLVECGQCVLVHRYPDGKVFTMMRFGVGEVPEYTNFFTADFKEPDADLEAAVLREQAGKAWKTTNAEAAYCNTCFRAALNLNLLLMHFGHQDGGPLDPVAYKKHRKNPKLEKYKHGDFKTVLLDQEIRFPEHRTEPKEPGEPTGREVRPHRRRRHWRMQPHGPNNSLRKRILIAEVIVREDRLLDGSGASSVVFKG